MKKLLLIGSVVHTVDYLNLIKDYFDDILLLTNKIPENYTGKFHIINFSLRNPINVITNIKKIRTAIEAFLPDIIHVHQANSVAFLSLKANRANLPVIVTAWGSDILLNPRKNYFIKKMVRYILSKADFLTSDSRFMAEKMKELLPQKKLNITIANFGVKVEACNMQKENLFYSNRMHEPLYRIKEIILSFAEFYTENNNWKLVVAGRGSDTNHLKKLAEELGVIQNIEFAGWLDKTQNQEFYNRSKVFVSIPESDATSISLLEAMQCGCLPVVSDLPANREWIENERNGIIVQYGEKNFLKRASQMNIEKAGKINAQIIAEQGTQEVNRKIFIQLYKKILA